MVEKYTCQGRRQGSPSLQEGKSLTLEKELLLYYLEAVLFL